MKQNSTVLYSCSPVLFLYCTSGGYAKPHSESCMTSRLQTLRLGNAKGGAAQNSRGIALARGKYLGLLC